MGETWGGQKHFGFRWHFPSFVGYLHQKWMKALNYCASIVNWIFQWYRVQMSISESDMHLGRNWIPMWRIWQNVITRWIAKHHLWMTFGFFLITSGRSKMDSGNTHFYDFQMVFSISISSRRAEITELLLIYSPTTVWQIFEYLAILIFGYIYSARNIHYTIISFLYKYIWIFLRIYLSITT